VGLRGPARIGSRVQIQENTVLHLLPDNELVIGRGAMIHSCQIGRGSVVEPGAVVFDGSVVEGEWVVRAGACVNQRDRFRNGPFWTDSAKLVDTLADPPAVSGWAMPADGVATPPQGPMVTEAEFAAERALVLRRPRHQRPASQCAPEPAPDSTASKC
jgi:carbonic anhydrase/acetyltransferase-like protein (isoleucine patch superfamily)